MSTPGQLLEQQHRDIDTGIQAIAEGGEDLQALARSLDLLRLHLYLEEVILFPPLYDKGLTMPVFVMEREHAEMWPLLQSLTEACQAGAPASKLQDDCIELFQRLQVHNPKEEQVLYMEADKLDAEAALLHDLTQAELPEGWVCKMA